MSKPNHNLEQGIKDLLSTWGEYVIVQLEDKQEENRCNGDRAVLISRTKRARYNSDKVVCVIVNPETPKEIDAAANAIVLAEQYAGDLQVSREHEMNHPNWWKSMMAKYQYNKLKK